MKTFKTYLQENRLAAFTAATALAGSALAAPPKEEAIQRVLPYMKEKEAFRPVAEIDKDARGQRVVVGYGTTDVYPGSKKPIKVGERVSEKEAEQHMKDYIRNMTPELEKIPDWDKMDAGKQAALISFGYNLGGSFYGKKGFETITQNLKSKDWEKVPSTLMMYNKAGGKELRGLTRRRQQEGEMWKSETAKPATQTQPAAQPSQPSQHYEVKGGDVLGGIAKQHGKSVEDLMKLNPDIKDPNKIKVGQKIRTK